MDLNRDGFLTAPELGILLEQCGEKVPGYQLRDYIQRYDVDKNNAITIDEFMAVSLFRKWYGLGWL